MTVPKHIEVLARAIYAALEKADTHCYLGGYQDSPLDEDGASSGTIIDGIFDMPVLATAVDAALVAEGFAVAKVVKHDRVPFIVGEDEAAEKP